MGAALTEETVAILEGGAEVAPPRCAGVAGPAYQRPSPARGGGQCAACARLAPPRRTPPPRARLAMQARSPQAVTAACSLSDERACLPHALATGAFT